MDVFRAIVRWLNYAEDRKDEATTLMKHVRFGLMSSADLLGEVLKGEMASFRP